MRLKKASASLINSSQPAWLLTGQNMASASGCSKNHCKCQSDVPFCCHTGWKITLVGSCFTHAAESRYAPVEGEALAVADALDKACFFVLGCTNLIIAVDHKPLLKIFGDRSLDEISNANQTSQPEGEDPLLQISHDPHPRDTTQGR